MLKDIIAVAPKTKYVLHLKFEDGTEGDADISRIVKFTGVFAPIKDTSYFSKVSVNPELGTISWPNGADIDPDVLYSEITGKKLPSYTKPRKTIEYESKR